MITKDATEHTIKTYASIAQEYVLSTCTDKIVPRKTVVFATLVDPTVIKVAGDRIKRQLFTKFGIRKPNPVSIQLASLEKYYEPYMVINARYFLDYYRMCTYTVPVDSEVREVILLNQKFYPEKHRKKTGSIRLEGEERLMVEKNSTFILSKDGREVNPETLPRAPSENNPEETIMEQNIREIDSDADVNFARKRLVHRPENLSRIVDEVFEVSERVAFYAPRFKLTYVDARNYEEKSIDFDGVTAEIIPDENRRSRVVRVIKSTSNSIFKN